MRKLLIAVGVIIFSAFVITTSEARDLSIMMQADINTTRPHGCPSKWCACYLNLILDEMGFQTTGSNRARDFASYGTPAQPAQPGSIMVMRTHVGVVMGMCDDKHVQIISGNYSRRVTIGCEPLSRAIAWRIPIK